MGVWEPSALSTLIEVIISNVFLLTIVAVVVVVVVVVVAVAVVVVVVLIPLFTKYHDPLRRPSNKRNWALKTPNPKPLKP